MIALLLSMALAQRTCAFIPPALPISNASLRVLDARCSTTRCSAARSSSRTSMSCQWPSPSAAKRATAAALATAATLLSLCGPVLAAADLESLQDVSAALSQGTKGTTDVSGEVADQFRKANNYGSVADFDKAFKLYSSVIKYAPGYIYGYSNRGNVQIAKGDLEAAIRDYSTAIKLCEETEGIKVPDLWLIHLNRGTTYLALEQLDSAVADLDLAVSLNRKSDSLTLANRAQAYERQGEWPKAVADYGAAIALKPGDVQPWWLRFALSLFQAGADFDALAYARRIATKFGDAPEPLAALTAILYGRGDTVEAQKTWSQIALQERDRYLDAEYLSQQLRWPPKVVDSLLEFGRVVYNPKS
eukprot:TRINITY_DN24998_c0_g1_i1.p1 TRINITY_DN24998_c0_g1~~TRINITY_DN24998_c0_g1_i1.p1  ORF type:complete len:417 (+),score=119.01 TRINITY_DN24998_c0_g1_i1:174-1253(+)